MKKQLLTLSFALCAAFGYSQTNNSPTWPATGPVGIGTATPTIRLDVINATPNAFASIQQQAYFGGRTSAGINTGMFFEHRYATYGRSITQSATFQRIATVKADTRAGYIDFNTVPSTNNSTFGAVSFGYGTGELMRINTDGKVRIGLGANDITTPNGYRLFVEEGILTEKVKVALSTTADWADYVFAPDYKLMPLEEVEKFTKENNHLPNVPSASEMVNQGLDVAKMDAKLLEKIEELTLYAVQQNNENKELRAELEAQKTATKAINDKQAKEIEELKEMVKVLLEKK